MSNETKKCGEPLYTNGVLVARCACEYGTEHSHDDVTAEQAVIEGWAEPVHA